MNIRQAHPEEEILVADVLSYATASLTEKGNALWGAAEMNEAAVKKHAGSNQVFEDSAT